MKLLIMQSSPFCHYFLPPRPTYLPQHPVLERPRYTFFHQFERLNFIPIQKIMGKIRAVCVLICMFLNGNQKVVLPETFKCGGKQ
jgi:hypothetical protein